MNLTEDEDHVLASRVCTSHEEARRLLEAWQAQHDIDGHDINDNSRLDLNELLAGIETNFTRRNN